MNLNEGTLPIEVIRALHEIVFPFKYQLRRSKDRLDEAISKIEEIKQTLPKLAASDGHGLLKCNEAKNMVVCAEITFKAALMRKETRGWHVREDYPERDDKNWLKWIIVKKEGEEMVLTTEPIPIDKYVITPFKHVV